jgi:hypothetical protein
MPASRPAPGELPYQEITDDSYASQAAPTFTIEESGPGERVLRGQCPRCQAIIEIPVMSSVFTGMRSLSDLFRGGARKGPADSVEPVLCTCNHNHPGRPEERQGCGAYWNFVIHAAPA